MLPLRTIAFVLSFVGLSATSLIVPALGVVNYMLIYQIYPEHAWWHKPLESLGIRYSMTSALCLMMGILINLPRLRPVRPLVSLWDVCAIGLLFTVVLSEFIGLAPTTNSPVLTDKFIKMMIFLFCLTRVTTTRRSFTLVMWALVIGSLYIGYDAWTAPRGAFSRGRLEVVGGPDFRHSSGLAAHMASMLPLIGATFLATRSWFLRAIPALSGALTVNTIVLCRTRSAFVGLLIGTLGAVFLAPKRKRLKTYLAVGVAGFCAYALTDSLFWDRMSTLKSRESIQTDSAAMGRITIWITARQVVAEHPLGVGIGNLPKAIMSTDPKVGMRAAHNTFILCITELGMHGFALFSVILLTSIYSTMYCHRRADRTTDPPWTRFMAYGLLLSLMISCGTQLFTERLYTESFWWILALPGCLKRVTLSEIETESLALEQGSSHADINDWASNNPLLPGGVTPGSLA